MSGRFSTYYSLVYLKKRVSLGTSIIYNSLLKYGYSSFSLDILEYCEPSIVIAREQFYIDNLKPEYNILNKAGSRLGTKESEETSKLQRIASKLLVHSEEAREKKMKIAVKDRIGIKTSFFGKNHTAEAKKSIGLKNSLPVKVMDIETNIVKLFGNNLEAAKYLGIGKSTLRRYKVEGKLYDNKYQIINA